MQINILFNRVSFKRCLNSWCNHMFCLSRTETPSPLYFSKLKGLCFPFSNPCGPYPYLFSNPEGQPNLTKNKYQKPEKEGKKGGEG